MPDPSLDDISSGRGYAANERLPELADQKHPYGRSLHEAWVQGDRAAVEHWLATADERERTYQQWLATDPEMVRIRALREGPDRFADITERFAGTNPE